MLQTLTPSVEPQRVRAPIPDGEATVSAQAGNPAPTVSRVEVAMSIRSNRRLQLLRGADQSTSEKDSGISEEFRLFFETHFLAYERQRLSTAPNDESRASRVALGLLGSGQPEAAQEVLNPFAESRDFWIQQSRAVALVKTSKLDEAEAVLRSNVASSPDDYRAERALGRFFLHVSRFSEARDALLRASQKPEADAITFNDCGVATLAAGDAKGALAMFRTALREDYRCVEATNNIAVCLQLRGHTDRAIRTFEAARAIEPSCAVTVHNLAESRVIRKDFDGAIELLERYRRSAPRDLIALESLAWAYGCSGNHARVVEVLEDAVEVSGGKDACILNNLAVALVARNRAAAAEKAYRRAIELDPEAPAFRINFAQLLATLRRWKEVLALVPDSEAIRENADALVLRSQALLSLSAYNEAAALLWRAHKAFPSDKRFVVWLGFVLISPLSEVSAGIHLLREGVQQWPDDLLLVNNLAYALIKDGQLEQARKVLEPRNAEIAAAQSPWALLAQATWGLLRIREGAFDEGMKNYERVFMQAQGPLRSRLQQKMIVERGRKELADGQISEARSTLMKAIKGADPEFTEEARALQLAAGEPTALPN